MSTQLTNKGLLVSLGLAPLIITLIGMHFIPSTLMLGIGLSIGTAASLADIISRKNINFFLLSGNVSIGLCFLFRLFTGYKYIPDQCNTPVLELLMLTFCFIYLTLPDYYQKFNRTMHLNTRHNYILESGIIVILSAIHLIILILLRENGLLENPKLFFLTVYLIPILIYIFCIAANIFGIRKAAQEEGAYDFIRIAPLWNGKIYLCPHTDLSNRQTVWDLPLEARLNNPLSNTGHRSVLLSRRITRKGTTTPRFVLRYQKLSATGIPQTIHLYILPLKDKQDLTFNKGDFFDFDELKEKKMILSTCLHEELEHLDLAASMWKEFY